MKRTSRTRAFMHRSGNPIMCCVFLVLAGCSAHNVKYNANAKYKIASVPQAVAVYGRFDEAKALFEQARLPHNTPRQRYELQLAGLAKLTSQLGSDDYVILGEVYGGGNARATLATLEEAFCKRAAKEGGDVVMIINRGVQERPYVYTTPGYATTNVYGSAYTSGNYTYGSATGYTTYTPGHTYAGTLYFPYGNGLVFKHVPGTAERRRAIARLNDTQLGRVLSQLEALNDKSITFEDAMCRADRIIAEASRKRERERKRGHH